MIIKMERALWALLIFAAMAQLVSAALVSPSDLMKCSYGERGSLTATCVNANSGYFRTTPYRFDQLDESLICMNCSLTSIESGTFDISGNQIKNLDLRNSRIEMVKQKAFIGLIFMENLIMSNNSIRSIYPGTFTGIKKLKSIDLSNNQIGILSDDGFLELSLLENLNLESNNIQTIATRAFSGLVKLAILNLKGNQISELKNIFSNLTSLKVLNLENNHIVSLSGNEFINLTSLLELNLSHNKLKAPVIELIPNNQLKNLFLHNNYIDMVAPLFLKGMHALENLDLSYNEIHEIGQKTLHSLYQLRNLNISFNKLTTLETGAFTGLPQLELLNCSHNNIKEITITGVFSLLSLHSLDISYNSLNDLDYVGLISRLPKLSYLRLEHNFLHCDLEDEMTIYFSEDNFKFVLYDNTVGSIKCIDEPTKKSLAVVDKVVAEAHTSEPRTTGAEVTIIVLMCVVFMCIGFLFYMQYRTYHEMRFTSPNGASSVVNLMEAEDDHRNSDNYLRE